MLLPVARWAFSACLGGPRGGMALGRCGRERGGVRCFLLASPGVTSLRVSPPSLWEPGGLIQEPGGLIQEPGGLFYD